MSTKLARKGSGVNDFLMNTPRTYCGESTPDLGHGTENEKTRVWLGSKELESRRTWMNSELGSRNKGLRGCWSTAMTRY